MSLRGHIWDVLANEWHCELMPSFEMSERNYVGAPENTSKFRKMLRLRRSLWVLFTHQHIKAGIITCMLIVYISI